MEMLTLWGNKNVNKNIKIMWYSQYYDILQLKCKVLETRALLVHASAVIPTYEQ